MQNFSHRDYFRRFRLNVEQYGEILAAHAFLGKKMGDEQVGYDILTTRTATRELLHKHGIPTDSLFFGEDSDEVRIEVKSKLSSTVSGTAEVVHCTNAKVRRTIRGKRQHLAMTHLLVVLISPGSRANREAGEEGRVSEAWLLTLDQVVQFRDATTRESKCLSVREIRKMAATGSIISVQTLLNSIVDTPLKSWLEPS